MIFTSTSHIGRVKKENQDAMGHLETEHGSLFVVCDGVGGLPNGACVIYRYVVHALSSPRPMLTVDRVQTRCKGIAWSVLQYRTLPVKDRGTSKQYFQKEPHTL